VGKTGESPEIKHPTNPGHNAMSRAGNLGAKYDGSPGRILKSLRRHSGTKCDQKKRRNKYSGWNCGQSESARRGKKIRGEGKMVFSSGVRRC
jgi:hypothetical protein